MLTRYYIIIVLGYLTFSIAAQPLKIAIVGFGNRAQWLLGECLNRANDVQVVAICDENAHKCIATFGKRIADQKKDALLTSFKTAFSETAVYQNNKEDLEKLCYSHADLDLLLIASANYDHFWQLNTILKVSNAKKIFIEKPLFITLEEFNQFNFDTITNQPIIVGLTLRYSSMAEIVAHQLQSHKNSLGELKAVKVWEYLNFRHALTSFIMGGWRRSISQSGGFMLEKVVHDMDLALYFLNAINIQPTKAQLNSHKAHHFFIKSRKKELIDFALNNPDLFTSYKDRSWQPFNFVRNGQNKIEWPLSFDHILEKYPDDDNFKQTDLIPDYQKIYAIIDTKTGNSFSFDLEVSMGEFRTKTERGQIFEFENGTVLIDIIGSNMLIKYHDNTEHKYDLKTNHSDHADGDEYIIDLLLDKKLPAGHSIAHINDPLVKFAHQLILTAEHQVRQFGELKPVSVHLQCN